MLAAQVIEKGWPKTGWPETLQLPTASGKTAVIDIAIFLLAHQANLPSEQRTAPRRIWFVVDRRIVVDEAYTRAARISEKLKTATNGILKETADTLRRIAGFTNNEGEPLHDAPALALARLRGGILQDDGWARLPSQPAVITSTVDQLGSRLLFRSYGGSNLITPIHAALAGNDSLIILDEAHCAQPFLQTLRGISRFRNPDNAWATEPLRLPFAYTVMSATPPEEEDITTFPATAAEREQALDNPTLQKRITVSKKAELYGPADDTGLIDEIVKQAKDYSGPNTNRQRVAIMVNRVATAIEVADKLQADLAAHTDILVLTGRIRPIERDALVEKWSPYLRANDPETPERPLILVTTQCLEVGADFSFDGLITECASLDALRQRFGRLNRLGNLPADKTSACIIMRKPQDDKKADPIYGNAIGSTWEWLNKNPSQPKTKTSPAIIDFGIAAIDSVLPRDRAERVQLLKPTEDAPVLLPAHLDMLCQNSPRPEPEPAVSLFLHGKRKTAPEVSVIWRADLDLATPDTWADTVALLPPSSSEAINVPLWKLRQWLEGIATTSTEGSDVEGDEDPEDKELPSQELSRKALIWRGPEKSEVINASDAIFPNDVLVLPVPPDGMPKSFGQCGIIQGFGPHELDLAERAHHQRNKQPVLRLIRSLWKPWLALQPVADLFNALDIATEATEVREAWAAFHEQVLSSESLFENEKWLVEIIREIGHKPSRLPEKLPTQGWIVRGKIKNNIVEQDDYFSEDADRSSIGDAPITIANHTADVIKTVHKLAQLCLQNHPELTAAEEAAARYHDIGKMDKRWQLLVHNGDWPAVEQSFADHTPLAKSDNLPATPMRRQQLTEDRGLPRGFRHEMLSMQLAEALGLLPQNEADLILHLIASHHGHARPFAPTVPDNNPPAVDMKSLGISAQASTETRQGWTPAHRLDSGVPERFWQLTRRFGWWGLPYLESLLRLADWHASKNPKTTAVKTIQASPLLPPSATAIPETTFHLTAINGTNPLGYLAAIGTLRLASQAWPDKSVRMCWSKLDASPSLVIQSEEVTQDDLLSKLLIIGSNLDSLFTASLLADAIAASPKNKSGEPSWTNKLRFPIATYRTFTSGKDWAIKRTAEYAAAWADPEQPEENNKIDVAKRTRFDFTAGNQSFIGMLRDLKSNCKTSDLANTLFEGWQYSDSICSMRWDPADEKSQYALQDSDPGPNPPPAELGANFLAIEALPLYPFVTDYIGSQPGFIRHSRQSTWSWPLWETPITLDVLKSLLALPMHKPALIKNRRDLGIIGIYQSNIVMPSGRYKCFTPAKSC